MTAPALTPHGFSHEAALYDSDEALLDLLVPFVRDGRDAGEPTILSVDRHLVQRVCDELGDLSGVTVLDEGGYGDPLGTLRDHHRILTGHARAGATRVRLVGQVPRPGRGEPWEGWDRYEAVVNHFYADLPVWSICPYDMRTTLASTLADVERTHPTLWTRDRGHHPNPDYTDPAAFLAERARTQTDPLEHTSPEVALADPSPADGRAALESLAAASGLDRRTLDGFRLAVNEALTNAVVHGRPPVRLRGWAAADRMVVTVHDEGSGPGDPYVGFLPPDGDAHKGRGLWIINRVCSRVTLASGPDGFTVRLVAGRPHPPAGSP